MNGKARFGQFVVLLAVLGVGAWAYRTQVKTFAVQAAYEVAPCSIPITYSVGSIDPRFGISTSSLVSAMASATRVWDKSAGKTLFVYQESGGVLTVNLVYDKRQATTQQLGQIGIELSGAAQSYDGVKAKYDTALNEYSSEKTAFDAAYAAYETRSAAYERSVASWNARGGAPQDVYQSLLTEKSAIDAEGARLARMQDQVNADADDVNALVQQLNAFASTVNAKAQTYNTVGKATGTEFEEGVFESQPGHEEIDIYEYDSMARLKRVLAHEFGHSIGLDHVSDAQAIMYPLNKGSTLAPTDADIAELDTVCRLK